jgi:hypothetical protein
MHSRTALSRRAAGASLAGRPVSLLEHHDRVAAHLRDRHLNVAFHSGRLQWLARGRKVIG